jgi:hypothetical protein
MPTAPPDAPPRRTLCRCGCGKPAVPGLLFIAGHTARPQVTRDQRLVARRAVPVVKRPRVFTASDELWEDCCAGRMPAEALPTREREDLIVTLFGRGWTLCEVATHTRTTEYTVARIARRALGHVPGCEVG